MPLNGGWKRTEPQVVQDYDVYFFRTVDSTGIPTSFGMLVSQTPDFPLSHPMS